MWNSFPVQLLNWYGMPIPYIRNDTPIEFALNRQILYENKKSILFYFLPKQFYLSILKKIRKFVICLVAGVAQSVRAMES